MRIMCSRSYVAEMWHIGERSEIMTRIARYQLMYVPNEGHMVFKIWSRETASYLYYVLSAKHICNALNVWHPAKMAAYDKSITATMIMRYVNIVADTPSIFAIMQDGRDISGDLKGYLKCFDIPENVTPRVVEVLYHWETNRCKGASAVDFYIIDYDLNEKRFGRQEFIRKY